MSEETKEIQWTIHKTHPEMVKNARDRLSEVVDPEIGMNIIQLGLVRDIEIENNIAHLKKILVMDFHGEVEGEDDRFSVLLGNFGRKFTAEDSKLLRETDPKEGYPDWLKVNEKRKELLLEGDKIYSYLGSYKSLINAIRFFGYYDLRIKEYWLNLKADADETLTPLQQNQNFIDKYSNQKSVQTIDLVGQGAVLLTAFAESKILFAFAVVQIGNALAQAFGTLGDALLLGKEGLFIGRRRFVDAGQQFLKAV